MDITIEWAGDDAEVRWLPADGELEIQPSLSPIELAGDFSACVASGGVARFSGIGQRVDGVFRRCFFLCRDQQNGRWVAASPHVDLQGAPNFRDYGGYLTAQGRQVAWGKLFRSGQLASLTDIDAVSIRQLDIGLVFDFRQDSEQLREPSRFAHGAEPEIIALPITPGNTSGFFEGLADGSLSAEDMAVAMRDINRQLALSEAETYCKMFEQMIQHPGASLVHCAAGKDRTGFAAAMVLSALGVPYETVMDDYLLTSRYFSVDIEIERIRQKYQWQGDSAAIRPMLEADRSYLRTAFDAIHSEFSSVDVYLRDMLGLGGPEREELRRLLLV